MVRKKHQSKRISASKRYKIERRVKEHQRKVRKEERLKPKSNKIKKDPGIPNLFPFKDKLLKEAEESKRKADEEKQRQKELRRKIQNQNRNLTGDQVSLSALAASAAERSGKFDQKTAELRNQGEEITDNSKKAFYHEFKKVVEAADVILEVLDARDPIGCRSKQVEELILNSGADKKIVLVLNKIDLVPREVVEKWLKFFKNEYPTVAFKASTQSQKKRIGQSTVAAESASEGALASSECLGADALMKLLKNYCRNSNIKTSISVGVIGFPNVGKSSLINSLKRSKACNVGATPGVTKAAQQIHLDKNIKLIDCPGIVWASGKNQSDVLLLRNCLKVEQIPDPIGAVQLLLKRCNRKQISDIYSVTHAFKTEREFLVNLALQRGKLIKGGVADLRAAAKIVLQDWNQGKIPYYVQPPKDERMLSSTVVSSFSTAFSVADIEEDEKSTLLSLPEADKFSLKAVALEDSKQVSLEIDMGEEEEEMEDDDEGEEDEEGSGEDMVEDEEEEEGEEEEGDVPAFKVTKKQQKKDQNKPVKVQKIKVAESELNSQRNKDLKKLQKLIKKGKVSVPELGAEEEEEDGDADYSFQTDFVAMDGEDSDAEGSEDDEEFDEIDMEDLEDEEGEEEEDDE